MKKSAFTWGLALLLAPGVAGADLFGESIPADAKVVLIVNDPTKLEAGAKAFAERSGLPLPPGASLNMLTGQLGLGEAWDRKQGVALALTELDQTGIVLLIPVTDPKAALDKLGARSEGKDYRVRIVGRPAVALAKGNLLIIAGNAETLGAFRSPATSNADGWSAAEKRLRTESNVFFRISVDGVRPLIEKSFDQVEAEIARLRDNPLGSLGRGVDPETTERLLGTYVKVAREVMAQKSVVYGSLSVDGDRVRIRKGLVFGERTYARAMLARRKPPTANLLDGLPQRPFYWAMGVDTAGLRPMVMDLFDKMIDEVMATAEIDAADRKRSVDKAMAMYAQMNGFNSIVDVRDNGMISAGNYFVDDPELAQRQIRDAMKDSEAMKKMFIPLRTNIKPVRKQVGNIDVDEFVFGFGNPEHEANAAQLKLTKAIYGDDPRMQFGVVGNSLGFAMADRDDAINILATKGKTLAAEPRIRAIIDDLPDDPFAIVLLDPFGFFRMVANIVGKMGRPAPFRVVPDALQAPPIGIAVTADAEGFTGQLVVRSDTAREIIKFVNKVRRR